jgi:hypothetical protein
MVLGKKKSSTSNVNDEHSKAKKKIEAEKKTMDSMDSFEKMTLVQKKIFQFSDEEVDEKKVIQVSQKLASPKGIQEAYLNKNFKQVLDYFQTIPKKEKKDFLVSGIQSDVNGVSGSQEQEEEDFVLEKEDLENLTKTNEKLKIKLVITEIAKSQKEKSLRKLLSPVASTLNIGPKCGKSSFF